MSNTDTVRLISRCDDFGCCHAANLAIEKCHKEGILTCTSIMVCCPWFEEAADIARRNPDLQVGVHTTLTAEWHLYRWGPVLPVPQVPSLVNDRGYFHPRTQEFLDGNPRPAEVEAELRAQIDRALAYDLDIAYVDYHMRTARATPELEEILLRLAAEHRVPVSRCVGDLNTPRVEATNPEEQIRATAQMLSSLPPGLWLQVTHPGLDVPEMQAMRPAWEPDGDSIAKARAADTATLTSAEVAAAIRENRIELVGYRDLRDRMREAGEL
jgi:predicted glycoside hydrolase/deacetylase ChbG (UPF0249 family)